MGGRGAKHTEPEGRPVLQPNQSNYPSGEGGRKGGVKPKSKETTQDWLGKMSGEKRKPLNQETAVRGDAANVS